MISDHIPLIAFAVLTFRLVLSAKSESNKSVTQMCRQILGSPVENGPAVGHLQEDSRLPQEVQNPLGLLRTEGVDVSKGGHDLWYTTESLISLIYLQHFFSFH